MGFDFNEDLDLPWSEGTAQMAITFNMLNNMSKVDHYLHELHKFQDLAPRTNNKGLVASPKDGLTTGFGWCYFNRLYVGATAWFIMASLGYNPFWHESEPVEEIPYSVRVQGKIEGAINGDYVFTGTVVSYEPVPNVTYSWQATEQPSLVNVRSGHDVVSFTWNTSGTKFITLTAQSAHGTGKYTHMIEIPTGTLPAPEYRLHGLNFGPFVVDGEDPSQDAQIPEERLRSLIADIAPYTEWIRTYSCGDGLEHAGHIARDMNLKIAMGAWLDSDLVSNEEQIACLIKRAKAGEVDIAIVGSESLYRNDLTAAQVIAYIQRVKSELPDIPVTTADVYARIVDNPLLVDVVDLVMVNLYPYWEGIELEHAVAMIHGRYQHVKAVAGDKNVIMSETGWPSCGEQIENAVASPENAAFYYLNFVSWARAVNVPYFYFETYDEPWKAAYEGPQGACWGIWDKDGMLKSNMQDVFDDKTIPDNWSGTAIPGGPGTPAIEFVDVPIYGSVDNLNGQVWHVPPGGYRVVVYIRVAGNWWIKPYETQPHTIILPDGRWTCDITTGGRDQYADKIVAYLIPSNYDPPIILGRPILPLELDKNAVARTEVLRSGS
ncbi:hypothetical protein KFU94_03830 [Chloroflexi bacterium TSY]|nr:hypothetical protein [Chloroflexi bacterium TSY]